MYNSLIECTNPPSQELIEAHRRLAFLEQRLTNAEFDLQPRSSTEFYTGLLAEKLMLQVGRGLYICALAMSYSSGINQTLIDEVNAQVVR